MIEDVEDTHRHAVIQPPKVDGGSPRMQHSPWLQKWPGGRDTMRLFCFPHAGGSSGSFMPWRQHLPPHIELVGVQLMGRGARLSEPPIKTLEPLLDQLVSVLHTQDDRHFAFFGHSMGGVVAFELARRLQYQGLSVPQHLFVCASSAPSSRRRPPALYEMSDEAALELLASYGGTPPEVLANRELMTLLLPVLRADFQILSDYQWVTGPPLQLPITVFAGNDDPYVSADDLSDWFSMTNLQCELHWMGGGHFFLNHQISAIAHVITNALLRETQKPMLT